MNKSDRLLILFYRLLMGERIQKRLFMDEFSIGRRSFDRYIQSVRLMLSEIYAPHELRYDAANNEYYLTGLRKARLRGMNVLPLVFLLMESRSFSEGDMMEILRELLNALPSDERHIIADTLQKLGKDYAKPPVKNSLLKLVWDLNFVIRHTARIRLWYQDTAGELQQESILPSRLLYANHQMILEALPQENSSECCIYPLESIYSFELL